VEITAETRRKLVLITKIVQNIANALEFGEKEAFMCNEAINSYIRSQLPIMTVFLEQISTVTRVG
jgi:hypothetical protein